jgi:hypothetical protein
VCGGVRLCAAVSQRQCRSSCRSQCLVPDDGSTYIWARCRTCLTNHMADRVPEVDVVPRWGLHPEDPAAPAVDGTEEVISDLSDLRGTPETSLVQPCHVTMRQLLLSRMSWWCCYMVVRSAARMLHCLSRAWVAVCTKCTAGNDVLTAILC